MLKKMRLAPKLIGAFVIVTLIALIAESMGCMGIKETVSVRLPSVIALEEMAIAQHLIVSCERGLVNRRMMEPKIRSAQYAMLEKAWQKAENAWKTYEPLPQTKEDAIMWNDFKPKWEEWKRTHEEVVQLSRQKDQMLATGLSLDSKEIREIDNRAFEKHMEAREKLLPCMESLEKLVNLNRDVAISAGQKAKNTMVFSAIIGTSIALLLGIFMTLSITKPMNQMAEVAEKLSIGDVDQKIDYQSADEVGKLADSFRRMIDYIKGLASAAEALANGDANLKIEPKSERDVLSKNMARTVDTLGGLVNEAVMLGNAAVEGKLDNRADVSKFQGGPRAILQGFNDTLDAVITPLNEVADALEKLAANDLTVRINSDYKGDFAKISDSFNTAVEALHNGVAQVAVGSEQVASASEQVGTSSQSLAEAAAEQASSLQEISSSLQEMTSMTKQNSSNAEEAKHMADEARSASEEGMKSMQEMSETINRIKASSDQTAKIIKTIDEIAFQTNLLALNAAVEAARAGDAGKGFAVVAEEVRNLAMRSAEAAKSTADMIEESVKNAEDGVRVNEEVLKNLTAISEQINKVSEVMAEIAAASNQQSQGIDQINQAVSQLDQITQQNAATSEESASAAQELSSQAAEMKRLVSSFKLNGNGHGQGKVDTSTPVMARSESHFSDQAVPKHKAKKKGGAAGTAVALKPSTAIPLDENEDTLESF